MIKVARLPLPLSLQRHSVTWTDELLQQVQLHGDYSKVEKRYSNRYNKPDVQLQLEKMYGEKCCYCETGIGVASYAHIEHRKPKALPQFHQYCFDWNNLHWSCEKCNKAKGNQWDTMHEIVDPTVDEPTQHFYFDVFTCKAIPYQSPSRGETTIEHVQLNRDSLVRARKKMRYELLKYIDGYHKATDSGSRAVFQDLIDSKLEANLYQGNKAEYLMFIKAVLEVYGDKKIVTNNQS